MALSGSFNGSGYTWANLYFTWSATQNVANNTSTITVNMYVKGSYGFYVSPIAGAYVTVAGTNYSKTMPSVSESSSSGWSVLLASQTATVSHNADGTLTTSIGGYYPMKATLGGTYYEGFSGSSSITLDTIPRASTPTLSAGSTALGSAVTINTNRASSAFTHTISYAYGTIGKTTIATGVTTSTAWTLPTSLASQTPSATSGTGTIYCDTYNGGTLIGTKTVSFTATIPNTVTFQPTISTVTPSETVSGVSTLALGKYVQGLSNVKFTIGGIAGVFGSTVSTAKITFNGTTYNASVSGGSATWNTGVLASSGTLTYSVTVTDSRGYTDATPITGSITVLPYSAPLISSFTAKRCDVNGNLDEIGTYLKITRNGSASSLKDGASAEKNTLACTVQWSLKGANSWATMAEYTVSASSTLAISTAVAKSTKSDFTITSAYDIKFTLTDKFNNTVSTQVVTVGTVMMSWGKTGVGIGKVWEQGSLDVKGDIYENDVKLSAKYLGIGGKASSATIADKATYADKVITSNSGGVYDGNGDNASSTIANLQIKSWFGIGFAPSISGQAVPQNQNAIWMNVRNGDISARNEMYAQSSRRLYHNGWCGSVSIDSPRTSNLNTIYTSGWSSWSGAGTGTPTDYGVVLTIIWGTAGDVNTDRYQFAMGSNGVMYIRCFVNLAWKAWRVW